MVFIFDSNGKYQTKKQEKDTSSPTIVLGTKHVGFSPTEKNPIICNPAFKATECEFGEQSARPSMH